MPHKVTDKERKLKADLQLADSELILYRSTLVRIINIISGRDEGDLSDVIELCVTGLHEAKRVIGRDL